MSSLYDIIPPEDLIYREHIFAAKKMAELSSLLLDARVAFRHRSVRIMANEYIPAFSVVTSDGRIGNNLDASQSGKIVGISTEEILQGETGNIVGFGAVTNSDWNWMPGDVLYLNGTAISSTVPTSGFLQVLGTANEHTTILVDLQNLSLVPSPPVPPTPPPVVTFPGSILNPDDLLYYTPTPRLGSGGDTVLEWVATITPPIFSISIQNPDDGLNYTPIPRSGGGGDTVLEWSLTNVLPGAVFAYQNPDNGMFYKMIPHTGSGGDIITEWVNL